MQHFLRKYASDFGVEIPTISSAAVAALQMLQSQLSAGGLQTGVQHSTA